MDRTLKEILLLILSFAGLIACPLGAQEKKELLGQGSDGNRSTPVHRIKLFDEHGKQIKATDENPEPFSTKRTCGQCHDYGQIVSGWHFNGHDVGIDAGRPGQPWVLTDVQARTQVPMSGRQWEGTFTPEQLGVSPWEFVKQNFSHFPGGSYGQMEAEEPDEAIRQEISGMFEINCLTCHNADPHQDQSEAALQAARQNYRWIPAGSSGMAEISGVASLLDDFFDLEFDEGITLKYKEGLFDNDDKVFFDIIKSPANERCYFCHSNQNRGIAEEHEWTRDEDVHLKSGLQCVDCHRNGDDHMITRGIETEGPGSALTCEGCHVGHPNAEIPEHGRLGASKPAHRGIPTIHFESLTCTACHSGPWPAEKASRWRTARMHKTGLHGKHDLELQQPHVYGPVMMKGADDKIAPHKLIWPAYWAVLTDGQLNPIAPKDLPDKARNVLAASGDRVDDWKPLSGEQIVDVLKILKSEDGDVAYIAGGKMYQLAGADEIEVIEHAAAQPYAWPMAHDVRPAEQALGVKKCKDCHTTESSFFFGKTELDTPVEIEGGPEFVEMIKLQGIDRFYMWCFNFSFVFRPMMKIVAFISCGLIGLVVLTYSLRAIAVVSNACTKEK
jgi:nitrate/TMAO reductase-like tetraheme cytochrome c subunit